ncbi:MAG: bifunctional 23S rRNA (guanine(2069)-N(7))-methyltransferase RlmK/23S rRNA (guanine(2445)-N(2))-methyltransferase RlmL, partial [Magnetococcales bacterium]|nr:bifunctional 23S rRNA (guanine(2069)-N(7))-methyltransferase RlmK/23S rRNA (guanine(2445)-N(2))-methyltransferase RlmL [Magnetococcales bacterium]
PWEEHLDKGGTLAVDFTGTNDALNHTAFAARRVKDAIVDRFRDLTGVRPSVNTEQPDLRINARLRGDRLAINIDLSGESLHRRGYRAQSGNAPLKQNLAAAILLFSNWTEIAKAGGPFLDPMCGSGTLPIEAAQIASDTAPGLTRNYFGFLGWLGHDADAWDALVLEARERSEVGKRSLPPILGFDSNPSMIRAAQQNADMAGFSAHIQFREGEALAIQPTRIGKGLLAFNPPYGERQGTVDGLQTLYRALGEIIRYRFVDWHRTVFTGLPAAAQALGVTPEKNITLYNGPLPCSLLSYVPAVAKKSVVPVAVAQMAEMFANRLKKNQKKLRRWLKKNQVTCYRLYDADMPEYALAVDVYEQWVHVQEYQAPQTVDPEKARDRLNGALAVIPSVLDIPAENIYLKVRRKRSGGSQYGKMDQRGTLREVREGGLRFLVNFTDYLDTGLFLDHAPTRRLIREEAHGRRFLNLFGYTGAATVYAADGGAADTMTVDLSNTYLTWARENMALNGFKGAEHSFISADCLGWVKRCHGRFGLIFLDPPTFSNSKSMSSTFDLQRDHAEMIQTVAGLLEPGGLLIFSNNLRQFKMDDSILQSDLLISDITDQTFDPDFNRSHKIHNCWKIQKRD